MRIGFDAKRAFFNNTGLGNYSRDTITLLSNIYKQNKYFLYTPSIKNNTNFTINTNNISIQTPDSLINKIFKSYWRSKSITNLLTKDKIELMPLIE